VLVRHSARWCLLKPIMITRAAGRLIACQRNSAGRVYESCLLSFTRCLLNERQSHWRQNTWPAFRKVDPFRPIVRLLMLTGQRGEEVAGMRWAELSGKLGDLDDTCAADQEWNSTSRAVKASPQAKFCRVRSDGPGDVQGAHQRAKLALVFRARNALWRLVESQGSARHRIRCFRLVVA
jgi:hypothetical protein